MEFALVHRTGLVQRRHGICRMLFLHVLLILNFKDEFGECKLNNLHDLGLLIETVHECAFLSHLKELNE